MINQEDKEMVDCEVVTNRWTTGGALCRNKATKVLDGMNVCTYHYNYYKRKSKLK